MKYGFMALFISMGKSAELGGEMGLPILYFSLLADSDHVGHGIISIPMLAKARNNIVAEKEFTE
jgi:hypothetical protein